MVVEQATGVAWWCCASVHTFDFLVVCGLLWDGLDELVGNVGQWCQLPPMRLVCLDLATWWLMKLCVLTKGGGGGEHVARLCGDSWCGCGHG